MNKQDALRRKAWLEREIELVEDRLEALENGGFPTEDEEEKLEELEEELSEINSILEEGYSR